MEVAVNRPQRWDAPFGASMRPADVDHLLRLSPFADIDASRFPASLSLRDLLLNDARIESFALGDLVVREGDYGNSAFFILSGNLRVVLAGLSSETLGRDVPHKRGWWSSLWQLATNPQMPEVRKQPASDLSRRLRTDVGAAAIGSRGASRPRVFLQDVPRVLEGTDSVILEPGEFFGELAALTRTQRSATVLAESEAVLLEIRWQGLRDLMQRTPTLRNHIEQLYRENSLRVHLRETPLLSGLPADKLEAVAAATTFESYGDFDWHDEYETVLRGRRGDAVGREALIVEEGNPSDGLILIRSGFARLSRRYGNGHRTSAYLGKGRVYGLEEAYESFRTGVRMPLVHSLRALGYVDVLRIPQRILEEVVFPFLPQTVFDAELKANQHYLFPDEVPETKDRVTNLDQGFLEFLVDRRLINGRQAMAIDLDRCIRCDDCVRACAETHDNNPRFVRQGDRYGPIQIASACMHCVDPVCMIGCPTGAIGRDPTTGVVRINDQTCIGCGTCADSCPYDNIRMVEIRDARGTPLIDETTRQPITKATKCDLCIDRTSGPACVSACSHDALVRIGLGNLGELSGWVGRDL